MVHQSRRTVPLHEQLAADYFFRTPPGSPFRPGPAVEVLRPSAEQAVRGRSAEFPPSRLLARHHTVARSPLATLYVEKAGEIAQAALDAGEDNTCEAWAAAQ